MWEIILKATDQEQVLQALIRAAASHRAADLLLAHRNAYSLGQVLAQPIADLMSAYDLSRPGRAETMAVVTALALLLHDIDEAASRTLLTELLARSTVHGAYAQRFRSVLRFTVKDYVQFALGPITVFTHASLSSAQHPTTDVVSWLRPLPPADLAGITRIYVIPKQQDRYWGTYVRVLANIVLVWRGNGWVQRLRAHATLLHEVGHHVTWSSALLPQEAEVAADRYAIAQLMRQRPALRLPLVRSLAVPLLLAGRRRIAPQPLFNGA